jgi:hypothetical protein
MRSSSSTYVYKRQGSTVSFVGAGNCTINANQAGNASFNAAPTATKTVTVNKASQTITFSQPTSPASAGTTASLVATSTSGLTVTFSTPSASTICTVSGTTVDYVGAGPCTINASQTGNGTYSAANPVQRSVTVVPTFAIIDRTSASPQNTTTVTGTGNPGATVTVYLCDDNRTSCGAGSSNLTSNANFTNPQTTTVLSDGTWKVIFSKVNNNAGVTYTLQAVQSSPNQTTPVLVFTTS